MAIQEAKLVVDRPSLTAVRTNGVVSPTFDDEDDGNDPPTGLGISNSSDRLSRQSIDEMLIRKNELNAAESTAHSSSNFSFDLQEGKKSKQSLDEDDVDSDRGVVSGPISGISGRERILESSPMTSSSSHYEMERKPSHGTGAPIAPTACYCIVWMAGEVIAQTKVQSGASNVMAWYDKFSFKDLPNLAHIQIDVMQSGRNGKFGILGSVILSMNTMRRGENIEGWYPIWSSRARDSDAFSSPVEMCHADEMMGEIKLCITIAEETILPLKKYAKVDEALHTGDSVKLMQTLCKELEEDQVVRHLVDIHTSKGTIVDFLSKLTEAESSNFGENAGPALLFRSNTLLTRAVDKYQRLYCKDWLDACIGSTVRRICHDRIWLEASNSYHYYFTPIQAQETSDSTSSSGTIVGESNLDALQRLCRELWKNIYLNRHRCPLDLRSALSHIRSKVNSRFHQYNHVPGPGIQGVGAFVFLRLICPAITTPNLYGLMGNAPNAASTKTLMLVAKVFLALANKRTAFDQAKEPWLVKANDFLALQATAYDDFITYVSTEPPHFESTKEPLGDEADFGFQSLIKGKVDNLNLLHRESIPSQDYMIDHPLTLASLVSYVVRGASADLYQERILHNVQERGQSTNAEGSEDIGERYDRFIDLCCDVEDQAGYHLDRAGYNPEPIDFTEVLRKESKGTKSTQIYTSLGQAHQQPLGVVASLSPPPQQSPGMTRSESHQFIRSRRATVSEGKFQGEEDASERKPMMSSIGEDSSRKIPLRFAPHLKSTIGGRDSVESDEEDSRKLIRSSIEGGPSRIQSVDLFGGTDYIGREATSRGGLLDQRALRGGGNKLRKESIEENRAFEMASLDDHSSLRKMKRGWWKK